MSSTFYIFLQNFLPLRREKNRLFKLKQLFLQFCTTTGRKAANSAIAANHSMARYYQRQWILTQGRADGSGGRGVTGFLRLLAISYGLAKCYAPTCSQNILGKWGQLLEYERYFARESGMRTFEVDFYLLLELVEQVSVVDRVFEALDEGSLYELGFRPGQMRPNKPLASSGQPEVAPFG